MVVAAVLCSPILYALARWYFEDLESLEEDLGYRDHDDMWWKLIRVHRALHNPELWLKVIGFVGIYAIAVGLTYFSIGRALYG